MLLSYGQLVTVSVKKENDRTSTSKLFLRTRTYSTAPNLVGGIGSYTHTTLVKLLH